VTQAQGWKQAEANARAIIEIDEQDEALSNLAIAMAQAQCWEQAKEIIYSIKEDNQRAQQWEQAQEIVPTITDSS